MKAARQNKKLYKIVIALVGLLIVAAPARAATEEQIEAAIEKGLAWLAGLQGDDGSWSVITCEGDFDECGRWCDCDRVAKTGLVVLKFETRAHELDLDPLSPEYEYSEQVAAGLAYILANAHEISIGPQPAGDPDGDGDGIGVYFSDCGYHEIYQTGIAMMAIAASGHPELYGDILQDAVDYMAWAQVEQGCPDDPCCAGVNRGGWSYTHNDCWWTDNSNSGYATLGLGYAQAGPPYGFSLTVPQFVKDELDIWTDAIQDDVDGDDNDGGSAYNPCWLDWWNILKTGNLIYEMGLAGDTAATQRVKDAVDYIERHWNDSDWCGSGWRDHRQAMFAMMKGLEALGIGTIVVDGNEIDWFDEVSTQLVDTQNPDGSWPCDCWGNQILSTAWALLTLEKAVPEIMKRVDVDIKPQSCPNPLNLKSKGILPVAILGSGDFDVTTIDVASVRLAGVAPIRSSLEDVATPVSDGSECECTEDGPDGYTDLTLKFKKQALVEALVNQHGQLIRGQGLALTLTGMLSDETPIEGADCIVVVGQVPEVINIRRADTNKDGNVNIFDLFLLRQNYLKSYVPED